MNRYFIIHGSFGNPFGNWFPYLRGEIEKRNLEVYTPDFPTGVGFQNYENWSKLLECYLDAGLIDQNTIIFAHSIAPVFVCKFLVEHQVTVKRLVFICGFNQYLGINEEYDMVNKSMYFDSLKEIQKYCQDIVCFYSDNDPYVTYLKEKEFADTITDQQILIKDGGHLNSEAGYTEFSELLKYI